MGTKASNALNALASNLRVDGNHRKQINNAIRTLRKYATDQNPRIKWSEENKETLRILIQEGKTFSEIAKSMNMREEQISGAVRRFRMQRRDANTPWTAEEDAILKAKWENETTTAKRIGLMLNRTEGAVCRRTQILKLTKFYTVNVPVVRMRNGQERLMILVKGEKKERPYLPYLWAKHNGRPISKGCTVIPRDGKWLEPTAELLLAIPNNGACHDKMMKYLSEGKDPVVEMDKEKAELAAATAAQQLQTIQDRKTEKEVAATRNLNVEKPVKKSKPPKAPKRIQQVVRKSEPVRKSKPAGRPDPRELAHVRIGKLVKHVTLDRIAAMVKENPGAVVEYIPLHGKEARNSVQHYETLYPRAKVVIL